MCLLELLLFLPVFVSSPFGCVACWCVVTQHSWLKMAERETRVNYHLQAETGCY